MFFLQNMYSIISISGFFSYRNTFQRSKRFPEELNSKNETSQMHSRSKRQNGLQSGESLCRHRTEFVMPRAAVNKDGNWMYVVNLAEVDDRIVQFVKAEICE